MVAEGLALFRAFCGTCVRRGRGEGLERSVTVDPWTVCESSSLADEETLIESGGVPEPFDDGVDL